MKRALAIVGMWAVLLAAWPAFAQQRPQGPYGWRGERMGPPAGQPQGRPRPPVREAGQREPPGRPERMTPEDRRRLRQDIHQYGRDVYRGRREGEKQ